jgi:solute carrier family 25 folate transporter 32
MNGGIGVQRKYLGTIDCIKKIIQQEGVLVLYGGCGLNLLKIIPAVTVQFAVYDYMKEFIFE